MRHLGEALWTARYVLRVACALHVICFALLGCMLLRNVVVVDNVGADMLRRRIRIEHVGVECLSVVQATQLLVEVIVRHGGGIQYVVLIVRLLQFFAQSKYLFAFWVFYLRK